MKKTISIFLILFVSCFSLPTLKADCNDVKNEANEVERYLVNIDTPDYKTVNINVGDLTQNLYIVVSNDFNDLVRVFHYSDSENGMISFDTEHVHESINYLVKVFSEDISCGTEPLKTISFKTKKLNPYSLNDVCNNTYDIEICKAFYDVEDMTLEEFNNEVSQIINELEKPFIKKVLEIILRYWVYVFVPFFSIVFIYGIRIIIYERGRKDV